LSCWLSFQLTFAGGWNRQVAQVASAPLAGASRGPWHDRNDHGEHARDRGEHTRAAIPVHVCSVSRWPRAWDSAGRRRRSRRVHEQPETWYPSAVRFAGSPPHPARVEQGLCFARFRVTCRVVRRESPEPGQHQLRPRRCMQVRRASQTQEEAPWQSSAPTGSARTRAAHARRDPAVNTAATTAPAPAA
jgi:hypothetical protein